MEYAKDHPQELKTLLQDFLKNLENEAPSSISSTNGDAFSQESDAIPTPIVDQTSDQSYMQKCAKLTDLYKLESEMPATDAGFLSIDIGIGLQNPHNSPLCQGTVYKQKFSKNMFSKGKPNITVLEDINNTPIEIADTEWPFATPSFSTLTYVASERDFDMPEAPLSKREGVLEEYFELFLKYLERNDIEHEYLNAQSHDIAIRENLGLPKEGLLAEGLYAGGRLLSTAMHYPGIHSSYVYMSSPAGSAFALHVEDFYLNSANILYEGAPKLWIVIAPSSKDRLESHVAGLKDSTALLCGQFVRHRFLLPQPSVLRQWGIRFKVVLQWPGFLMLLQPHAYHYGLNLGANIAEAINYADPEWIVPPLYRPCAMECFSDGTPPMLPAGMKIGQFRPLDLTMELPLDQHKSERLRSKNTTKKKKGRAKNSLQRKKLTTSMCKGKNHRASFKSSSPFIQESSASESDSPRNNNLELIAPLLNQEQCSRQKIPVHESDKETINRPTLQSATKKSLLTSVKDSHPETLQTMTPGYTAAPSGPTQTLICSLSKIDVSSKPLSPISRYHPSAFPISAAHLTPPTSFPLDEDYCTRAPYFKIKYWIDWWKIHVEQNPDKSHIPKNLRSITVETDLQSLLPLSEDASSNSSWLNNNIVFGITQTFVSTEHNTRIIAEHV